MIRIATGIGGIDGPTGSGSRRWFSAGRASTTHCELPVYRGDRLGREIPEQAFNVTHRRGLVAVAAAYDERIPPGDR